jgi:aconitate hydratase
MGPNVTQKLIAAHLAEGEMRPGAPIALKVDQSLTQDATGTLVMLALEAMGLERTACELSAQYVDHNLIQADHRNADDHLFLESACRRFGVWYSRPGNGVSHPLHMQRFGLPGKTLLGSDSHTCAAGSLGMLAIGAGGLDVAMAMAGEPFHLAMPKVWGVRLVGELPEWVSAKDVILEMLRRHDVDGGLGRVIEYHGPGLESLRAMDRHVIANMGAELGATTTVFPSDEMTRRFLRSEGREDDWSPLVADTDAGYDEENEIDLSALEPLIAKPTSPGNVVPVREIEGEPVYQAYIGSSANPGYRDVAVAALMVRGRRVAPGVSFDVNPTSRQLLETLIRVGLLSDLIHAGARLHQAGCNGCIGMGQAPATGRNSLRTVPRNFPGRSGTREDSVFLCSPETATAAALTGRILDPRSLGIDYPEVRVPDDPVVNLEALDAPPPAAEARTVELVKGPNIVSMPELDALPDSLELTVLVRVGDDVSTDEILPAGAEVLPYRSNIPRIADFAFAAIDRSYPDRARALADGNGHAVVAGDNYGQGSSREHAALAPRHLGLRLVLAKTFARIHRQNLINYGVLPLTFAESGERDAIESGDVIELSGLRAALEDGGNVTVRLPAKQREIATRHDLSARQRRILLAGGLINWARARR